MVSGRSERTPLAETAKYLVPYREWERRYRAANAAYYKNPERARIDPFRIVGNLYYVGDAKACPYLLATGDGLILFDTGFPGTETQLLRSIRALDFDPAAVRCILHTHGHYDHFGGTAALRKAFGCTTYLSRADAEALRERPARSLREYAPDPSLPLPEMDVLLEDGDVVRLGDVSIRCVLTPGHSPGVMTFFFDVADDGRTYRVGYFGGVGFNTLYREALSHYGLPPSLREDFLDSINRILEERVDITLGNHPAQNATLSKIARLRAASGNHASNPFVDPTEWASCCASLDSAFRRFLEAGF